MTDFPFDMTPGQAIGLLEGLRRQAEREHRENATRYLRDVNDDLARRTYFDSGRRIIVYDKAIQALKTQR